MKEAWSLNQPQFWQWKLNWTTLIFIKDSVFGWKKLEFICQLTTAGRRWRKSPLLGGVCDVKPQVWSTELPEQSSTLKSGRNSFDDCAANQRRQPASAIAKPTADGRMEDRFRSLYGYHGLAKMEASWAISIGSNRTPSIGLAVCWQANQLGWKS